MLSARLKKTIIVFGLLVSLGTLYRFYNFSDRINFSSEQGLALQTSADYLTNGFSFLGQRTFLRTTSVGHIIFSGALYNYSLVPLLKFFNYDPIPITVFFGVVNLLGGLTLFLIATKIFGRKAGLLTLFFYLTSAMMINHSLFIWILHYLPITFALTILSCFILKRKKGSVLHALLLGLYGGVGFNFEYFYLFTILGTFIWVTLFSDRKIRDLSLFIVGAFVGNFTMVIFDLRHDFYTVRGLWQYLLDTINNPGQSKIDLYHFFQFWPLLFLLLGFITAKLSHKSRWLALSVCVGYLAINLKLPLVDFTRPVGMPKDLNFSLIDRAAMLIGKDSPSDNFNVTSLPDADFRAYTLRYLVTYRYSKSPKPAENYSGIDTLYALAPNNFVPAPTSPWEVTAMGAKKVEKLADIGKSNALYKLTR